MRYPQILLILSLAGLGVLPRVELEAAAQAGESSAPPIALGQPVRPMGQLSAPVLAPALASVFTPGFAQTAPPAAAPTATPAAAAKPAKAPKQSRLPWIVGGFLGMAGVMGGAVWLLGRRVVAPPPAPPLANQKAPASLHQSLEGYDAIFAEAPEPGNPWEDAAHPATFSMDPVGIVVTPIGAVPTAPAAPPPLVSSLGSPLDPTAPTAGPVAIAPAAAAASPPAPSHQNGHGPSTDPTAGASNPTHSQNGHPSPPLKPAPPAPDSGAITATTRLPKGSIVESLIDELRQPDPIKRHKVIWELSQRGDTRAVQPLVDLMVDSDSKQRSLILSALSEIGGRTLRPMSRALAISLQDPNADVRKNAIRDLTRVYDMIAQISQMVQQATEDPDREVQETARWALGQLNRIRPEPPALKQSVSPPESFS
jgi:HEAT repeats